MSCGSAWCDVCRVVSTGGSSSAIIEENPTFLWRKRVSLRFIPFACVYSPLYQSYRDGVGYTFVTDSPSPTGAQRAATFMKIPVFTHRWQTFHSKRQPSEPAPTRLLLQVALTRPECGVEWGMSLIDDTTRRRGCGSTAACPSQP